MRIKSLRPALPGAFYPIGYIIEKGFFMSDTLIKARVFIVLFILAALFLVPANCRAQFTLMLNKNLINVLPPDHNGTVMVYGVANAVVSDSAITAEIVNVEDNSKVPVIINPDGSFIAYIMANPGESVRLITHSQDKKSYRTFTVPPRLPMNARQQVPPDYIAPGQRHAQPSPQPTVPQHPKMNVTPDRAQGARKIAVLVTVIDTQSGEIIANERIVGSPAVSDPQKELINLIAENLIWQCRNLVESEMLKSATYEAVKPVPPPAPQPEFQPGSLTANDPNEV